MRAPRSFSALLLPLVAALALVGCDSDDGDTAGDGGSGDAHGDDAHHDSGHPTDGGTAAAGCDMEDRDDEFSLGLTHEGAAVRVAIADAVPAMPIRGDNSWTVAITDAADAPMEGVSLVVTPWMPDHGHGSPVQVKVTPVGDGEYEISPLNLFMAGYWEITLETTDAEGGQDEVMFKVCVE